MFCNVNIKKNILYDIEATRHHTQQVRLQLEEAKTV